MQIFINRETRRLQRALTDSRPLQPNQLDFKRGDAAILEISFLTEGVRAAITTGSVITFCCKLKGKYDGDAVVFESGFTASGSGASTVYTAAPSFNTVPLDAALEVDSDDSNDLESIDLMGEITWTDGPDGDITSTETFLVRVYNDVYRGDEETPAALPDPSAWTPAPLALTAPPVQGVLAIPAVQASIQIGLADFPGSGDVFQVGEISFEFLLGITEGSASNTEIILDGSLEEVTAHFLSQLQNHPGLTQFSWEADDTLSFIGYVDTPGAAGNSETADTNCPDIAINGIAAPGGTTQNFLGGADAVPAVTGTVGSLGQLAIVTIAGARKYSFRCVHDDPMTWEAATPGVLYNTTLNAWRRTLLSGADAAEVTTTEAL